ncbi:MAG: hydroxypyruvate isomerase [Proteobacteria bacterium]|jgi:hydroxypyruvate isomerase|nr:hydroxypyruvate isomerase [Pseudomonadota bacterium]
MPRFAANLSMMYTDMPFLDRFAVAAADGFRGVEYLFPYDYPAQTIAALLRQHGLTQVLFNLYAGDFAGGERGLAALPGREDEFAASIDQAIAYARVLNCRRVHAMAGVAREGMDPAAMRATYLANLQKAATRFAEHDVMLLIEPVNARDMPGYFLNRQDEAHAIAAEVGAPNLAVQMDFYHAQIVEGDLARKFEHYQDRIGHVQIASVPERNEPDTGEVNYPYLFDLLDHVGYNGWVGCEYRPARTGPGGTSAGLGWFKRYRGKS